MSGFHEIDDICRTLVLNDVVAEDAKRTYKIFMTKKTTKSGSHMGVISSCIFLACRKNGNPIPIKEIASLYNVSKKDIQKAYCLIKQIIPETPNNQAASSPGYARKLANELNLPLNLINKCSVVTQRAQDSGIVEGKSPLTLATAVVFMMANLEGENKITFQEIAKSAGVSVNSIRNCYKQIYPERAKFLASF